ncbi:D-amino acid dehydrogenase [Granulosicoccus antarcticus]|uniref:D-amino acid dehydrogenase 1 n=1 Tax=Granulosicoccus antarcticus IMCC3135 TaxID=1192854 RepID=A0A2Z2NRY3_9GAMM|nr:D-amino acid dehydrogenase [Granulosicoccus antarcticus]ASJ74133.1 D-amino acid dehydrogenase 1 [Granulosicoccus antarcticus IMCC3135]
MKHIAVVGAGISGVTTAYSLLKRGYNVTILDRNRYAAMMTSFANGGQLSASNAEVWTQFSTIIKGMRWMLKRDAPLLVNPKPDWHKYSWMAEFMANIPNYESNTIETTRLAIAAREHLFEWAKQENIDFDHEARGILHICVDKAGFEHGERVNAMLAKGGLERRAVTPDEMRAIEPAIRGDLYGGFYTESDSTGDIHKYTRGLAQACERMGGRFMFDVRVQTLTHEGDKVHVTYHQDENYSVERDTFDGVVICAGIESRRFAAQLGDRVNIYPVKGYSITIDLPNAESREAAAWVSLLDDKAKVVSSRLGENRLRIAGTAEFNGVNYDIRDNRIRPLVAWTRRLFPGVDTEHVVPWAGLRPMMPNMMPRVGAGKKPGVYYNTGHGHLGWTLCPATSEILADVVEQTMPV